MKKDIREKLINIRNLLREQNVRLIDSFRPDEKLTDEFNRNQDIIEAIEKVLKEKK